MSEQKPYANLIYAPSLGASESKIWFYSDSLVYDEFIRTVTVNLKSVFLSSQVAINHMRRTGGGSIINISSIGGQVPDLSQIGYGTSKGQSTT